ncbi:mitochondrial protein required for respiration [Flagelloscypha sp. PMI_526]|nr:mitochondrial protein required for respiration [Flagelloscypha sp. PMI_526]
MFSTSRLFSIRFIDPCRYGSFRSLSRGHATAVTMYKYKTREPSRFNPFLLLAGFMPIFTFGLGIWQLKRLQWKVNLIDELEEKLQLPPIRLPEEIDLSTFSEFIWRKVEVSGIWDHAHTMLVTPNVKDGVAGVRVVTPLLRPGASTILVDRGFVATTQLSQLPLHDNSETVHLLGMIRSSQPKNAFTLENKPEKGEWHWIDTEAMAGYAGGAAANVQPVFVEQIFEGSPTQATARINIGEPVGREPTVNIRNAHLSYVITWFSLSAFTSIAAIHMIRKGRAQRARSMPRFK